MKKFVLPMAVFITALSPMSVKADAVQSPSGMPIVLKMTSLTQRSDINAQYKELRSDRSTKDSVVAFKRLYDILDSGSAPVLRDEIIGRLLKKEAAAKAAGVTIDPLPSDKFRDLVWPPKYFQGKILTTAEAKEALQKKLERAPDGHRDAREYRTQVAALSDQLKRSYVLTDNDIQRAKTVAEIALWAADAGYTPAPKL